MNTSLTPVTSRTVPFGKLHVCGNDFVMVRAQHVHEVDMPRLAKWACDRKHGVGADDLVRVQHINEREIALLVVNPDGSIAPFCGNACLAAVAFCADFDGEDLGITVMSTGEKILAGRSGQRCFAKMPPPSVITPLGDLATDERKLGLQFYVNSGTHHRVVFSESAADPQAALWGPKLSAPHFLRESVNVMFVRLISEDHISLCSWERGGTGISLACGSGAVAAVAALSCIRKREVLAMRVSCAGGELLVRQCPDGYRLEAQVCASFEGAFAYEIPDRQLDPSRSPGSDAQSYRS